MPEGCARSNLIRRDAQEAARAISCGIASQRARLARLFDALETGRLEHEDLAPRIKELRKSMKQLVDIREELLEAKETRQTLWVDRDTVLAYARGLKHTLNHGTLSEREAFLKGIKKIAVYEDLKSNNNYLRPNSERKEFYLRSYNRSSLVVPRGFEPLSPG